MDGFALVLAVFYCLVWLMLLAWIVLMVVAMWKIYVKMGEPGWKAIVPYYNLWTLIERLRKPRGWFWIIVVSAALYLVLYVIVIIQTQTALGDMAGFQITPIPLWPFMMITWGVLLIYNIKLYHALSRSFGHGAGFTVGLILVPVVFLCILAFGPDQFKLKEDRLAELYSGQSGEAEP